MLLFCCRITEADQMNIISTKDDDATLKPEDEEEEEDYTVSNSSYNTTLRNAAAYTLKLLAELYPEQTFQHLQSVIDQAFQLTLHDPNSHMKAYHSEALDLKEAAILALGSIAEVDACQFQMEQGILTVLTQLLAEFSSESALVQATSIWACSRFTRWISQNLQDSDLF